MDGIEVKVACPSCAAVIVAPYKTVTIARRFVCGCGEHIEADLVKISASTMMDLLDAA